MTKTGEIQKTYLVASKADQAFQTALEAAGFRSRWDWKPLDGQVICSVEVAYRAKLAADAAHSRAWAVAGLL